MAEHAAWVYLLRCADGSLYCGWTTDLERRLAAHEAGRASRYTRSRRPVALAAAVAMPDRTAARQEEARIKRLPRAAKLALVAAAKPARVASEAPARVASEAPAGVASEAPAGVASEAPARAAAAKPPRRGAVASRGQVAAT